MKSEYTSLAEISSKILSQPAIRLEKTRHRRQESPLEFLKRFFTDYNLNRDTIFLESKEIQTPKNKRRSIDDIWRILHYYYPDLQFTEFCKLLHVDLVSLINLRSSWCNQMRKRAYYFDGRRGNIFDSRLKDQHGMTWNEWSLKPKPKKPSSEEIEELRRRFRQMMNDHPFNQTT